MFQAKGVGTPPLWKAEAGGSRVLPQPTQLSDFVSSCLRIKNKRYWGCITVQRPWAQSLTQLTSALFALIRPV